MNKIKFTVSVQILCKRNWRWRADSSLLYCKYWRMCGLHICRIPVS